MILYELPNFFKSPTSQRQRLSRTAGYALILKLLVGTWVTLFGFVSGEAIPSNCPAFYRMSQHKSSVLNF